MRMICLLLLLLALWNFTTCPRHSQQRSLCFSDMVRSYSFSELRSMNSSDRLSDGIYNHCAALGIARRRYIHRGSKRRYFCSRQTDQSDNNKIPVIWSSYRRSPAGDSSLKRDHGNICVLKRTSLPQENMDSINIKMALINTRSIVNKSFILNNFFTSQSLDFLFITETWVNPGEQMALGI